MYTLQFGLEHKLYVVFANEDAALSMYRLFGELLGMQMVCFGGYLNAYGFIDH